ncbi:nucleoporin NUP42 isoform X2 [Pezoporus occidentalis]|uniref:nucleoporin NUP42 isoform X2 n=1 Tax=Pezoporus occidentalis TaxID=407982 RepID=UPI002F908B11
MAICQFFLQGRCRFGERCWNEHPRGGVRYGPSATSYQGTSRGGWGSANQRHTNVIQPSTFKSNVWGGSRDYGRGLSASSGFGSSGGSSGNGDFSQNRFSVLVNNQNIADGYKDEEERLLESVVKDMETWESSGQWIFSSYSPVKEKLNVSDKFCPTVSRPMENSAAPVESFKCINKSSLGFPVISSSSSVSSFSFKTSSSLVNASSGNTSAFGSSSGGCNPPAFGATSSLSVSQSAGFGSPAAPTAASFSFKTSEKTSGFGTSGFSGFGTTSAVSSSNITPPKVFGDFSAPVATSPSHSGSTLFGQTASDSGQTLMSAPSAVTNNTSSEKLFTPKSELSAEDLKQFEAKKFTIGKIPLKPPPLELLNI